MSGDRDTGCSVRRGTEDTGRAQARSAPGGAQAKRWVQFRWPSEWKGKADVLAERAGLVARHVDGELWRVTTDAQYHRRRHAALFSEGGTYADPVGDRRSFRQEVGRLEAAPGIDQRSGLDPRVDEVVRRLLHVDDDGETTQSEAYEAFRLLFMCLPDQMLADWSADVLTEMLAGSMPGFRLTFLRYSPAIHTRMAFVRGMFAADHGPDWYGPDTADKTFGALGGLGGAAFSGGTRLVDPLVAANSPWISAYPLPRLTTGMLMLIAPFPLVGKEPDDHSDLVTGLLTKHLSPNSNVQLPATPTYTVDDVSEALAWWVRQTDALANVVLDPTVFSTGDGRYDSAQHYGLIVTFERLYASVVTILLHTTIDPYSRRVHMFDALDMFEGLRLGGTDKTLDAARNAAAVERLRIDLPAGAARVLLPRAEAAVSALRDFGDSFLPSRRTDDSHVRVANKQGRPEAVTAAKAATRYLRVVRNAGHGMRDEIAAPEKLSVLAAHTGDLPDEISDIPYLHLLRLLADPALLARPLLDQRRK